MVYIYICS